jgi:hypothetical protein
MTENLDQFFDKTNGLAVSATLKTAGETVIRSADVNFTGPTGNVPTFGDTQFEAVEPFMQCKTADLAGVDRTCKVVIGSTTYRIKNELHDGAGISTVFLK